MVAQTLRHAEWVYSFGGLPRPSWSCAEHCRTRTARDPGMQWRLRSIQPPGRLALGLALELRDDREPLLHGHDGYVTFDPSTGSYYYSRPRMVASGSITLGDEKLPVTGSVWFDHQWGDFLSVGEGWDWSAVNLDDGTDLTVPVVREPAGRDRLVYGTIRDDRGSRRLGERDIIGEANGEWTSPRTAITRPAGWRLEVPDEGLVVDLRPTVAKQELDTSATTGVIYWEGSQVVRAEHDGVMLGGEAYVDLTGYGPDQDRQRRPARSPTRVPA